MVVENGFEDFVDHAEVVFAGIELLFEVDEVGGDGIEAEGEEAGNVEIDLGILLEEGLGVFDEDEGGGLEGAYGGHMGTAEEDGDFSKDGAGRGDDIDLGVFLDDFHGAFFKDEEGRALVVFDEDVFAFGEFAFGEAGADFECGFHVGRVVGGAMGNSLHGMGLGTKRKFLLEEIGWNGA